MLKGKKFDAFALSSEGLCYLESANQLNDIKD